MDRKLYLNYLKNIKKELEKIDISTIKQDELLEKMENFKLIIPVIGSFSAGKSTLINSFLNKNYLLTAITPETSLATEIYYTDKNEKIELMANNKIIYEYSIDEIEKIKEKVGQSEYAKIYINNENIKNIEPIIIVDMPGFDSPLDLHNRAILSYLEKGAHYVILINIEDGTLTRTLIRQIEGIKNLNRDFSFFLSKANLRASSEIEKIKEEIESQIEERLDVAKEVVPIFKDGGKNLQIILNQIEPIEILKNIFFKEITDNYIEVLEDISLKEVGLKLNLNEIENILLGLKESMKKTLDKKEKMLEEVKMKNPENKADRIVNAVAQSLTNSLEELANIGISGNAELFSATISDIVRNKLIEETQIVISEISDDIIFDFKQEISNLKYETINNDIIEKLGNTIGNQLKNVNARLSQRKLSNKNDVKAGYRAVTSVLGITTSMINPLVEVIIVFLPDILSLLFGSFKEKQQKEKIKKDLVFNIIPDIKRKLKQKLIVLLQDETSKLIEEIGSKFEEELQEKTKILNDTQKEKEENIIEINELIKTINESKKNINIEYKILEGGVQ